MKLFTDIVIRIKSRFSIWISQARHIIKNEGVFSFIKKLAKKAFRYLYSFGNPHRMHRLQYGDWQKNVEAKYLNAADMHGLDKQIKKRIKFSIIFPVWNKSVDLLQKALDSVSQQKYDNWEICISDGSSKEVEETVRFLEEFKKSHPQCVKLQFLGDSLRKKINIIENSNKCIEMATGDFCVFMDCDDELSPNCLLELASTIQENPDVDFIYSDFDKIDKQGSRFDPSFWPDWSPHSILSQMYTTHVTCYRTGLLKKLGGLRKETQGAQDWDLVLRLSEKTDKIVHIPKILYHWRLYEGSTAMSNSGAKDWAYDYQKKVLQDCVNRRGWPGTVVDGKYQGSWRVKYDIKDNPKVSIIIPFKDAADYTKRCVESIKEKTSYDNYEIVLVNNQSIEKTTFEYLEVVKGDVKVLDYDKPYHFGKLNNWAAENVDSDHVLFLNNDTKILNPGWLSAMLEYSQMPDVGLVGAKLFYPNGKIQHAGVIVGAGGAAAHSHRLIDGDDPGYNGAAVNVRDVMAVTAACAMIKKKLFLSFGGFSPEFDPAYQDVDLGIRLYEKGYWNIFTPYAQIVHYESITRFSKKNKEKLVRDEENAERLKTNWPKYIWEKGGGDPFHNPNFSYKHEDYRLRVTSENI
ncbi:glycosyltransferase family 2 protein [Candidatus Dojkabacteria bacterium]|nr:glycosyltransferase family 2 protein [Candidatus Dojkabacteria bacterium]